MTRADAISALGLRNLLRYRGDRERRVVDAAEVAWWRCDEHGTITESEGPGLWRVDRYDGELVGRNIWRDWPHYADHSPMVQVRDVLSGRKSRDECLYWVKINGHEPELWWARVAYDPCFAADGTVHRGVLVVTHRVPALLPAQPAWGAGNADGRSSP